MAAPPQAQMKAPSGPRNPKTFTDALLAAWSRPKVVPKISNEEEAAVRIAAN